MMKQLAREWRFMFRQRYVLALLICSFIVSSFAVYSGMSEVAQQRQTIERLKQADVTDRKEAQKKYNDPGSLAYYSFHLTYSPPSNLAFAALGDRDIYPWKHRVRMLALEGQIYESDAQNAELAQAGKVDFTFVMSILAPLFVILLFHDLIASERSAGRHDFLVATAQSYKGLWRARAAVRFVAISLSLLLPFIVGALLSNTHTFDALIVICLSLVYLAFWALLSVWFGKKIPNAPRIASGLIGIWLLVAFVLPTMSDLLIQQTVASPKGGDVLMVQREAVNDAWDLPVETTMQDFIAVHPDYANRHVPNEGFDWGWYYAFQQVGDQKAAQLAQDYSSASLSKYHLASFAALLSPPSFVQRSFTRLANTDAIAAHHYEQRIRQFHRDLRMFYYPWLFTHSTFDKSKLNELPVFEDNLTPLPKKSKTE